ncbi:MAG: hypothetical protein COB50_01440 [Thiotrichales bacterium]|nr:MAG: hypothetical protein COB50_01440 [Thiotrichales bacterium]
MFKIPFVLKRSGTSKGIFLNRMDLPSDSGLLRAQLMQLVGVSDAMQTDGMGGGYLLSNKIALISKSSRKNADLDFLFAAVLHKDQEVNFSSSCGNIMAGVVPYAMESGILAPTHKGPIRVYNENINCVTECSCVPVKPIKISARLLTSGEEMSEYAVSLNFKNAIGGITGKLLPTGNVIDVIDGIEVSCVDMAMPMVFVRAKDFGKSGVEFPLELNKDTRLINKLRRLRSKAGRLMGIKDNNLTPKITMLSPPVSGGNICARYLMYKNFHPSFAVTGAVCLATSCCMPGSIAAQLFRMRDSNKVVVEHGSGYLSVDIAVSGIGNNLSINKAVVNKTTHTLLRGTAWLV